MTNEDIRAYAVDKATKTRSRIAMCQEDYEWLTEQFYNFGWNIKNQSTKIK